MCVNGCVAMILAGGRGERLGALTHYYAKPAVYFSGDNRIIDFTLHNCLHAGFDAVGILSQHLSSDLHAYIEAAYDCRQGQSFYMLPPKEKDCYCGTADALLKNIDFLDRHQPVYVLVLASDQVYKMDYVKLVEFHKITGADVTVASTMVPKEDTARFDIISAGKAGRVYNYKEKPGHTKSHMASMGIYVFKWERLKKFLLDDSINTQSGHDLGKDVLPFMISSGESVFMYPFHDYWQDVGTVENLWAANMNQINHPIRFTEKDVKNGSKNIEFFSHYVYSPKAEVRRSLVSRGCSIMGKVEHSVIGENVTIGKGSEIIDSFIMPGVHIGSNITIRKAVIGIGAVIADQVTIGADQGTEAFIDPAVCPKNVSLVAPWLYIHNPIKFKAGSHIYKDKLKAYNQQNGG